MITDCLQVFHIRVISWKSSATPERLLKGDMISFNSSDIHFSFSNISLLLSFTSC